VSVPAGLPDPGVGTVRSLFVYGTLRRGDVRWSFLEPYVHDDGIDDTVQGRLFDTGLGYPAAVFDASAVTTITGRTYHLVAERLDAALAVLDDEEDTVLGLYRRVIVTTGSGRRAWAYAYGSGLELRPIDSGDWFAR
jgi:gamma-glutamylcyclotransferase (GGCT)/AIG2-like uncharacterized protein YtfP